MKKQNLNHTLNYDLYMVYGANKCYYLVAKGEIKIKRNGDYDNTNVMYYSKDLNKCLEYINKRW